jgi:hypothetical protein
MSVQFHAPAALLPREASPVAIQLAAGLVRSGRSEEGNIFPLPRIEQRKSGRPARALDITATTLSQLPYDGVSNAELLKLPVKHVPSSTEM